jgi:sugar (pentulose or hexulose) kinase
MAGAVVGIDIGTGSARAIALDRDGTVLGTATAPYADAEEWPPGRARVASWRSACLEALGALAARAPAAKRPAALAVGGQSPTTVAVDGGFAVTIRHPAGNDVDNAARQQAQRAVIEAERGAGIAPRQLWDWLLESLGAETAQGRWPGDPLLDGFGPRRTTGEVVGAAKGEGALARGTPLVTGAQDAYLAFWAGGIDVTGRAMDPGGRTGGLAVAVPAGIEVPRLWTFASAARDVAIAGGAVNAHGIAVEWLSTLLARPIDDLLDLAAAVPPGARGLLFLPYLEGERAPRWDTRLRGVLAGLDAEVTPAELVRAVIEGTALGIAHVAEALRAVGRRVDILVCAGQPARSEMWCRVKGAVLGVDVEVPEDPDLAAYGAALAAGAGAGWWPRPGEGSAGSWPRPPMRRLPPLANTHMYCDQLRRFIAAGDLIQAHPDIFGSNADATVHPPED